MNAEILAIGQRLRTQNNQCTAEPMFCVQEKRTVYGMDPQWTDSPIWIDISDGAFEVPAPANGKETDTIVRSGKHEYWETVMVALTDLGCREYISLNGHNHRGELRIYVMSFRRCPEMVALRAFLIAAAESEVSK